MPYVVDAGANIGDFALAMARKGGRVVALEPGPENYKHLLSNIKANRLPNILPLMVAAHSKLAFVTMAGSGSSLHVVNSGAGLSSRGVSLDQLVEEFHVKTVDIVKLDVQGHERNVVLGMKGLLEKRLVGILIVEVHLVRGVRDRDISSLLESLGYRQVFRDEYLFDQHHLYFTPRDDITLSS